MTREELLQETATMPETKVLPNGLTIRKIGLQEEFLFSRAGIKILHLQTLKAFAEGKAQESEMEELGRAAFICTQDPQKMRSLVKGGADAFDDAYFAWLGTIDAPTLAAACEWTILCACGIAAATFRSIDDTQNDASLKNAQSPAVQPS